MDGEEVGLAVELFDGVHRSRAAGDDLLVGEERVEGADVHAEGLGFLADETADVAVGLDTEFLALELGTGLAVELAAGHENHQGDGELGHGVGVLSRGVLHDDAMGGRGGEVDIVEAGTGTDDDLELFRGVQHGGRHLVGTDDEGLGVLDGLAELGLAGVLLEELDLVAGGLEQFVDIMHSRFGERLLGCNENFHDTKIMDEYSCECLHSRVLRKY